MDADAYLKLVSRLPRPPWEQIVRFAWFVAGAHCWYKHLPVDSKVPFLFFLDPHAGKNLVMTQNGKRAMVEITHESCPFHDNCLTTRTYLKGAQAVVSAVFPARTGKTKEQIKDYVETSFGYDMGKTLDEIRPRYCFEVSCRASVPQAIRAFLESRNFEEAIRLGVHERLDDQLADLTRKFTEAFECP